MALGKLNIHVQKNEYTLNQTEWKKYSENAIITAFSHPPLPLQGALWASFIRGVKDSLLEHKMPES